MPFEIRCPSCSTTVTTSGARLSRCPECSGIIRSPLQDERRSPHDIQPIRDWITDLRLSGGDFSAEAAAAARDAAWSTRRSGGSLEDAFQSARHTYYTHLQQREAIG